jgi:hypothetical protein
VSIEESLDKVVAWTSDDEHLHRFVSAVEGRDTTGELTEWHRLGDQLRHRVQWKADAYRGWLEVSREGYLASVEASVHTSDDASAEERLDRALGELKDDIEAVDLHDLRRAEACKSFVVETVLKGLIKAIPAPQRTAMAPYLAQAHSLASRPDLEQLRAQVCVHWAREAAERLGNPLQRAEAELVEAVEHFGSRVDPALVEGERRTVDLVAKAERFDPRTLGEGELPPHFHEQLNDAYEALKEAHRIARRHGWDEVPWPSLLEGLFAVTSNRGRPDGGS